jgi:hypothetical protein
MKVEKFSKEWLKSKMNDNRHYHQGDNVYWMFVNHDGKWRVIGWRYSEDEAQRDCWSYAKNDEFEVLPFPTVDESQASRYFKGYRLKMSGSIDEAIMNLKHGKTED